MGVQIGGNGNDVLIGENDFDLLIGGGGDDTIRGGAQTDALIGGEGDDLLIGDTGDDQIFGGEGNDTIVWNNGDGSDLMEGGNGLDTVQVNGSVTDGDNFNIEANGQRVRFDRLNLIPFTLDVDDVEDFVVNGGGGNDTLSVQDLTETDIELVTFAGDDGDDLLDGSNAKASLHGYGNKGNDTLVGGETRDTLWGGQDEDLLRGGNEVDRLLGNMGNDTLIGDKGDDEIFGGLGDDLLIWNNGDGSDFMKGAEGLDTVQVNGAIGDGDEFSLEANGGNVRFQRNNLGLFALNVQEVEAFEINGNGGDDSLTVENLDSTDVEIVAFDGGDGNDFLDASNTNTPIFADGGAGDDILIGGSGDDTLVGGAGADLLIGGAGNDILIGGDFDDPAIGVINTLEGNDGSDSYILANENITYYNDGDDTTAGLNDYAVLADFNTAEDSIELNAGTEYVTGASPVNGVSGTAIYIDSNGDGVQNAGDELVAVAQDVTSLDLNASYVTYV
ncbi:calcium-binding protein [Oscillatoriales cyanobacterium LEGE 11467]|uniref:Calcium-binding protein n=1 Tax=Zarconia navalis LEGE 11467 TaxID=1828826 RepID=A0A928Z9A2_9CYAN|nr:calcium-binding protein [Zarconia navalis]MBE9042430.1 calcium-binding protein [Zarconia navalis LEGE 11467]